AIGRKLDLFRQALGVFQAQSISLAGAFLHEAFDAKGEWVTQQDLAATAIDSQAGLDDQLVIADLDFQATYYAPPEDGPVREGHLVEEIALLQLQIAHAELFAIVVVIPLVVLWFAHAAMLVFLSFHSTSLQSGVRAAPRSRHGAGVSLPTPEPRACPEPKGLTPTRNGFKEATRALIPRRALPNPTSEDANRTVPSVLAGTALRIARRLAVSSAANCGGSMSRKISKRLATDARGGEGVAVFGTRSASPRTVSSPMLSAPAEWLVRMDPSPSFIWPVV